MSSFCISVDSLLSESAITYFVLGVIVFLFFAYTTEWQKNKAAANRIKQLVL